MAKFLILTFVGILIHVEILLLHLRCVPHFLVLVNKVVWRKLCPTYLAWEVLDVQVFHNQHFLVSILNVHSNRIDVSPEIYPIWKIRGSQSLPFVFLIAVVRLEDMVAVDTWVSFPCVLPWLLVFTCLALSRLWPFLRAWSQVNSEVLVDNPVELYRAITSSCL